MLAQKGSNKAQESIRAKDTLKIETIEDFAKWALIEKTGKRKIFYLCNVVPAQAIIINKFSKHDISKYKWILDNFGIRHILNKPAHGIKTVDLNKVYSIINTFNKIVEIDAKKDVVMLKVYKDFIDYRITFFAEIRPKNNEITIITMYKNRNKE